MKAVTAAQMQHIDRTAIEKYGLPSQVLMAYAGKAITDFLINNFDTSQRVAVFCGPGNNAGDGFVIAYLLHNNGFDVQLYTTRDPETYNDTVSVYYKICKQAGLTEQQLGSDQLESIGLSDFSIIIDALFGTGFSGPVRGTAQYIINKINSIHSNNTNITIVSVDIASGLPASGTINGSDIINADYTVSVGLPKINQVTYPGKTYTGKLIVVDIGFPAELTSSDTITTQLVDRQYCRKCIQNNTIAVKKHPDTHKGEQGHLLLAGGFPGMEGAIMLAARAALETGTGLISLITTNESRQTIAGTIPELMTNNIDPSSQNFSTELDTVIDNKSFQTLLIGPGMGRSKNAETLFNALLAKTDTYNIKTVIIDGDGLYHLVHFLKTNTLPEKANVILTPHFKEASRLLNESVTTIKNDRPFYTQKLSQMTGSTCVLKGPCSIISKGNMTNINTTGNPLLATAGSGDVLAGIIAALSLTDSSSLESASVGVYIHGRCADIIKSQNNPLHIKSGDIITHIKQTITEVVTKSGNA